MALDVAGVCLEEGEGGPTANALEVGGVPAVLSAGKPEEFVGVEPDVVHPGGPEVGHPRARGVAFPARQELRVRVDQSQSGSRHPGIEEHQGEVGPVDPSSDDQPVQQSSAGWTTSLPDRSRAA